MFDPSRRFAPSSPLLASGRWQGMVKTFDTALSLELHLTEANGIIEGTAYLSSGSGPRRAFFAIGARPSGKMLIQLRQAAQVDVDLELRVVTKVGASGRPTPPRLVGVLWLDGDTTIAFPVELDAVRAEGAA
jgi:hypothetical protein